VAKVRVPRTPAKAFDTARRPSSLLLRQIEHLEWAVLPASQRKPGQLPTARVKSEAQAAERVAQLMTMLREAGVRAAAARGAEPGAAPAAAAQAPVILPPLPRVAAPATRRPATRARKTTPSARRRRSGR
jgi:hypothetical protein